MNYEFSAYLKSLFFTLIFVWIIYSIFRIFLIYKIKNGRFLIPVWRELPLSPILVLCL